MDEQEDLWNRVMELENQVQTMQLWLDAVIAAFVENPEKLEDLVKEEARLKALWKEHGLREQRRYDG